MDLLSGWAQRIERAGSAAPAALGPALPKSPSYYSQRVEFVDTVEKAQAMVQLAEERPLSHVGFDTEFRYDRPGVLIKKSVVCDPRSVRPLLLSLAMVEPAKDGPDRVYQFVIDLRVEAVREALQPLLRLPLTFVGHYSHVELLCLLRLGLPEPRILWDTWVSEKALHLGRNHRRYKQKPGADSLEHARAKEETDEEDQFSLSLVATCQRYGVEYPIAGDKARLQKSFLEHAELAPFTQEQIEYSAADALAAAALYLHQVQLAARAGILHHLLTVEMPWVTTNAHMVWIGVRVDPVKSKQAAEACATHVADLEPRLTAFGITNANSPKQLRAFFAREGLLDLFRRRGEISFEKKLLGEHRDRHPAIPIIHAIRRVKDLLSERVLSQELVGADGRVHPEHSQLGTHTGRQTSRWPNLLGLGRVFRPLIVPDHGYGIGEVDLSQIEVGVAGAVYGDERLVEMFNGGDVYANMAQAFYSDQLSDQDRLLSSTEFKRLYPDLRNRMKGCTLGIIFGVTAYGLAQLLRVPATETAKLLERFLGMFPSLKQALANASRYGGLRGYAVTATGLRRYRANAKVTVSSWERNWMANHPVQGSAAVAFKVAGNRLDRLYQRHSARLIVPMHDAYVFEAPLGELERVAQLTSRVMCDVVEEYFPQLRPRAEINVSEPQSWNKDGHADSIDRWIEDPLYTF